MNSPANAMPESFERFETGRNLMASTRPFYWSVRRELWENRWIYLALIAVAAVILVGHVISLHRLPGQVRAVAALDSVHYRNAVVSHYDISAAVMMLMAILISFFYSMDALHGERRDRSILFWKSMPVSDVTTVLAKATIPLVVVPVIATAVAIGLQAVMLVLSSAVLLASGVSVARFWSELAPFQMWMLLLYHIITAHALWPAPIYAWLILVSGWARRAVLLWAALPVVAMAAIEGILFRSWHVAAFLGGRLIGAEHAASHNSAAIDVFPTSPMTHITPLHFLISPGVLGGLLVAAIFLALAVLRRRSQGPM